MNPRPYAMNEKRTRIRWYHFYFVLAIFDVLVILMSLRLHNRTISDFAGLIESAGRLDDQARWLQLAQQRVVQLNAPGNDIFRCTTAEEYERQRGLLATAKANLSFLDEQDESQFQEGVLKSQVYEIVAKADAILDEFAPLSRGPLTTSQREKVFIKAAPRMADMDDLQHEALWVIGGWVSQNNDQRRQLIEGHAAALQARANEQRYFVAAVVLMLVGILAFGRKLQRSDRDLQEERQRSIAARKEHLAAIGELCSSVAHGIRNPIAAICSSVELALDDEQLHSNTRQRLQKTLREGERLSDRVVGLLDLSRCAEVEMKRVDLARIVQNVVQTIRLKDVNPNVETDVSDQSAPIIVLGDERRLELAITELVVNAIDQSNDGGDIRVDCGLSDRPGRAFVAVSDHGQGVGGGVEDRIFDLFFTTKPHGTGIGLASVRRVCELHGGTVQLDRRYREGARFVMEFPVLSGWDTALQDVA